MGKCKDRQRKFCITKANCKHSEGGYGGLPLGIVYTCHGFLKNMQVWRSQIENFFSQVYLVFVDRGFNNLWELAINKIIETPKTTLCNSR
jgi:hypothetical protein